MAAPNIVNVATITGKTAVQAVGTAATAIVTNSAASGKVIKLNSLIVANIDGSNTVDITVDINNASRTPATTRLAYLITVPPKASLTVLGKDTMIYLEESDAIRLTASNASRAEATCSYEEIS